MYIEEMSNQNPGMARVLVIEDDPTQRLLATSVLKSAGYEVLEATDGDQGLHSARHLRPDLIVCDVMMPGLNGYEMVAALKEEDITSTIPVIFLSAMNERAHIRVGMATGADDYLPKPFTAAELKQSVESLLAKRQLQQTKFAQVADEIMAAALDDQRHDLAGKYEKQLLKELNERWQHQIDSELGLQYDNAPVLAVELFGPVLGYLPSDDRLARAVKRVHEAASDALYLFGATHLVPFGRHLIAIFADEVRPEPARLKFQAVRSAFAVQKALRAAVEALVGAPLPENAARTLATMGLHIGPVTLLRVKDSLHGGEGTTLVTGEAVSAAIAIGEHARAVHWQISCSAAIAVDLTGKIGIGKSARVARGANHPELKALELLAIALP
jgi:CheY-like chemotaxis protein